MFEQTVLKHVEEQAKAVLGGVRGPLPQESMVVDTEWSVEGPAPESWQEKSMVCACSFEFLRWEEIRGFLIHDIKARLNGLPESERLKGTRALDAMQEIRETLVVNLNSPEHNSSLGSIAADLALVALQMQFGMDETGLCDAIRQVYASGGVPCGWAGKYPDGKLIVYWPYHEDPVYCESSRATVVPPKFDDLIDEHVPRGEGRDVEFFASRFPLLKRMADRLADEFINWLDRMACDSEEDVQGVSLAAYYSGCFNFYHCSARHFANRETRNECRWELAGDHDVLFHGGGTYEVTFYDQLDARWCKTESWLYVVYWLMEYSIVAANEEDAFADLNRAPDFKVAYQTEDNLKYLRSPDEIPTSDDWLFDVR